MSPSLTTSSGATFSQLISNISGMTFAYGNQVNIKQTMSPQYEKATAKLKRLFSKITE